MQTIKSADKQDFEILIKQLTDNSFSKGSQFYQSIQQFLEDKDQQLPDIDQEQLDRVLEVTKDTKRKVINEFRNMVIEFRKLIPNYKQSKYQIKHDNGTVYTLQRMNKKRFQQLYINFTKEKLQSKDFYEQLDIDKPFDISIFELKLLISTYQKETSNKKKLIAYTKYIEDHVIQDKYNQDITKEYFISNMNSKEHEVINKCFEFIKKSDRFDVQIKQDNVISKFINILKHCQHYHQIRVLIDPELYSISQKLVPLLVMKSFQIYLCYPDTYKIVNSQIFNFNIPICYTSPIDADSLFINDINKQDYHLTKNQTYLHKLVFEKETSKNKTQTSLDFMSNVIHHKNFNQFDNNIQNLLEVKPDKNNTSHQKHMKLHSMGQQDYKESYFRNYIDIIQYRDQLTFYKHFIENTPNDSEKLEYLFESTFGVQPVSFTIDELIETIRYRIRIVNLQKQYKELQPNVTLQQFIDYKI
ncbi:Hypothetical_protein [Hexamita inflata]|uniref:Hypothetical_protein n=1 Tax=Hexamita inflata TaxID=28002 RepID=A0AA86TV47_9EUKA|nr:Hypothetical protein HINF_LOCUS10398 [Hexamita inflata]